MPTEEEHSKIGYDVMALWDQMDLKYSDAAEVAVVGVRDGDREVVSFHCHDYHVIPGLTARSLLEHGLTKLP
jgi:hypothetical protein